MIWTLAGEVGGYNAATRPVLMEKWREIALEIDRINSYHHLQTAHYTNERPLPTYYQDDDWYDFTMSQCGHGDYPIEKRTFKKHMEKYPCTPFIESEAMYENIKTLERNGRRRATPEMVRRVAYTAVQCGACGYTYGAQGMWHLQWDEPKEGGFDLGFGSCEPWHKVIDYIGADQMTIMRDFYESVNWPTLKPLDAGCFVANKEGGLVITFSDEELQEIFMPCVTADDDMSMLVAYYADINRFPVGFRTLVHNAYRARWFSPETGEYTLIADDIHPQDGCWFAPAKTFDQDAILVLQAK